MANTIIPQTEAPRFGLTRQEANLWYRCLIEEANALLDQREAKLKQAGVLRKSFDLTPIPHK